MKRLAGRILALLPVILLQIALIVLLFSVLKPISSYIYTILYIVGIVLAVTIVSKQDAAAYKQAWLFFILLIPIIGSVCYLLFGNKKTGEQLRRDIDRSKKEMHFHLPESEDVVNADFSGSELRAAEMLEFGWKMTGMETYRCDETRFYSLGEKMLPDLLDDLKKAEKFIFMEYFIVEEGKFWDSIVDVLAERVKAGVDVRFMYDDLGSLFTYSKKNVKKLTDRGIKCVSFNPIRRLTLRINNRDHRKMTIIDGKIAYSGGVNLADEYINEKKVYGHWKDIAFRVQGDAAISYTYMFTEFWNAFSKDTVPVSYIPDKCEDTGENGFVFSYYDSPVHDDHICNTLLIELLSQATKYIWFYTPYLLLDASLSDALIRTARRGVDVRIIMPGIPDKKMVYRVSRSYYLPLMHGGVKIYEYLPGFVHAKAVVCDDAIASIGTSNMDFRSLFLHFENNSIFCLSSIVSDIKKDFDETLEKCVKRKLRDGLPGTKYGVTESLLRLIAPLL